MDSMDQAGREAVAYQRTEAITGSRRRRKRSAQDKAPNIAEILEPGANISDVARRNSVSRRHLTKWRPLTREARGACEGLPLFATN
jgi:transposase